MPPLSKQKKANKINALNGGIATALKKKQEIDEKNINELVTQKELPKKLTCESVKVSSKPIQSRTQKPRYYGTNVKFIIKKRKRKAKISERRQKHMKQLNMLKKISETALVDIQRPESCPPRLFADPCIEETSIKPRSQSFSAISAQLNQKYNGKARISFSPRKKKLTIEQSVELRTSAKLTDEQFEQVAQATNMLYSLSSCKRKEKEICDNVAEPVGKYNKIASLIIKRVKTTEHELPENIEIVFAGDKDGNDSKAGFYLVDVPNPLSPSNLTIVYSEHEDETVENLKPVGAEIDEAILQLQDGIQTSKGFKSFTFFITGDNKWQSAISGCQGGSADRGWLKCKVPRASWHTMKVDDISPRTIQDIENDAKNILEEISAAGVKKQPSAQKISSFKRKHNSVSHTPLIKNIPLNHYVPGAVQTFH